MPGENDEQMLAEYMKHVAEGIRSSRASTCCCPPGTSGGAGRYVTFERESDAAAAGIAVSRRTPIPQRERRRTVFIRLRQKGVVAGKVIDISVVLHPRDVKRCIFGES